MDQQKSAAEILKKEVIRALWILLLIVVFFLFFRILFRLLGVNPHSPIVAFFYLVSDLILLPFVSMFPQFSLTGGASLDVTAFMGMIVYVVAGFLLMGITAIVTNMFKLSTKLPEAQGHKK